MEEKSFTFPVFEEIQVSTKTFIVQTNIVLEIKELFKFLPITDYVVIPKKRGRKKKIVASDPNQNIADGSIITLDLANDIRGVLLKKKKKKGERGDYFRNSVTVVMIVDGKKINFKISNNGKFQMTGCKKDNQAEECVKYIWNYIKDNKAIYTLTGEYFRALFIPAMRNIDFSLGFNINREALDTFINRETDYHSLLETSIGYTGVNIKFPVTKQLTDLKIKQISFENGNWVKNTDVPCENYLETLKPKEKQKKLGQERFNTFLVFHSGKTIMSSMCEDFAKDDYYKFLEIIKKNYKIFEEKLDRS